MIVSHPESNRGRGIIHENPPDIGESRKKVRDDFAGSRIETQHAIAELSARPDFAVLIPCSVVRPGLRCGRGPLLKAFRRGIEHSYAIGAILAEP